VAAQGGLYSFRQWMLRSTFSIYQAVEKAHACDGYFARCDTSRSKHSAAPWPVAIVVRRSEWVSCHYFKGNLHERISYQKRGRGTVEQRPVDWSEAALKLKEVWPSDSATTCSSDPESRAVQPRDRQQTRGCDLVKLLVGDIAPATVVGFVQRRIRSSFQSDQDMAACCRGTLPSPGLGSRHSILP